MQMPSLWHGEDAAVANGINETENSMQHVRHEVQVQEAGARILPDSESNVHVNEAFEFASEGFGAEAAEGAAATAAPAIDESKFNFRRIQRWG